MTAVAALISISSAQASDVHWLSGTTGNWSNAANWDTPPSIITGTDTVIIDASSATVNSTVDSGWASSGTVAGITFAASADTHGQTITVGSGITLNLGSGGILNNRTAGHVYFAGGGTLGITTGQEWKAVNGSNVYFNVNLSGTGNLTLSGSGSAFIFQSGNSTAYTGTTTFRSSAVTLSGNSQLGRLGSTLNFGNGGTAATGETATANLTISGLSGVNQQIAMSSNINFVTTNAAGGRNLTVSYTTTGASSLAFTGAWSGDPSGLIIYSSGASTGLASEDLVLRFQGNNSAMTSTKTGGDTTKSAIYVRSGVLSLENANALGSGNSLTISLGNGQNSGVSTARASLFAKSGISVAAPVYVNSSYFATVDAARSSVVKVGIQEAGSTSFSGTTTLQSVAIGGTATSRTSNFHLVAATGGTASFTGPIKDSGSNPWYVPVIAEGGGVVAVSGSNSYSGNTSVIGATTFLANNTQGSATGSGSVRVGYGAVTSITGNTTNGSAVITNVDTTNLVVGQTITGAGIPAGSIITFIHPTIANRIEISQNATATSSGAVALTANAETGILGGTGRIAPGASQTITVANGSSIAPGAIGSIGSLTLDGTSTATTILTMETGAKFTFDLGTANNSDQLIFWNFTSSSDLVLNNNEIDLNNVQLGTFTLFKFYSDGGSTAAANSLILDFTNKLTVAGYDHAEYTATLSSVDNTIVLSVASAVPEPSTWAMIVGGLGMLAFGQRIRRKE